MLVLWAPYLQHDNPSTARQASTYLSDRRVEHFWDLWRFGSRTYSKQFNYPLLEAWDLFVGYEPGTEWKVQPPEEAFYLQNRDLDHGTPYTKQRLERELLPWLEPGSR